MEDYVLVENEPCAILEVYHRELHSFKNQVTYWAYIGYIIPHPQLCLFYKRKKRYLTHLQNFIPFNEGNKYTEIYRLCESIANYNGKMSLYAIPNEPIELSKNKYDF